MFYTNFHVFQCSLSSCVWNDCIVGVWGLDMESVCVFSHSTWCNLTIQWFRENLPFQKKNKKYNYHLCISPTSSPSLNLTLSTINEVKAWSNEASPFENSMVSSETAVHCSKKLVPPWKLKTPNGYCKLVRATANHKCTHLFLIRAIQK